MVILSKTDFNQTTAGFVSKIIKYKSYLSVAKSERGTPLTARGFSRSLCKYKKNIVILRHKYPKNLKPQNDPAALRAG